MGTFEKTFSVKKYSKQDIIQDFYNPKKQFCCLFLFYFYFFNLKREEATGLCKSHKKNSHSTQTDCLFHDLKNLGSQNPKLLIWDWLSILNADVVLDCAISCKRKKKIWPSRGGIRTSNFLKFLPTIWIIEGDGIKSRQGS